jgi:hypothetical protein
MKLNAIKLLTMCTLVSIPALSAGCSAGDGAATGQSEAELSNNEHSAYLYFKSKGLSNFQAAAIVGNLIQESSVEPGAVQYGGGPGRGIAQWSVGGRWDHDSGDNMVWYAEKHGLNRWALEAQLDFVWYELTSVGGYGYTALKDSSNITSATIDFQDDFEGCGECDQSKRVSYAEQVLSSYGGGGGGGGGSNSGKGCYSDTLGKSMPDNACVQSRYDSEWYQCDNGDWVNRWSDPTACNGTHPL